MMTAGTMLAVLPGCKLAVVVRSVVSQPIVARRNGSVTACKCRKSRIHNYKSRAVGNIFALRISFIPSPTFSQIPVPVNRGTMSESIPIEANKAQNVINKRASTPSSSQHAPPSDAQGKYGARPACFKSTLHEVLFVVTCSMAIGLSSMAGGAITVISSFVGRDLGMSNAEITWLSAASSLAAGSFLLLFGKLADLFGRRLM